MISCQTKIRKAAINSGRPKWIIRTPNYSVDQFLLSDFQDRTIQLSYRRHIQQTDCDGLDPSIICVCASVVTVSASFRFGQEIKIRERRAGSEEVQQRIRGGG
ncbi:hypothetical protein [Parapedobacter sp. 2B3]|uniref:hypothetical protein n=1 Tax=Parapedobacter sp. 2B3 TaxID=3342381 RepID=UPI0035B67F49